MLDFEERNGKLYWKSEITKVAVQQEKATAQASIKNNKKIIYDYKMEIKRLTMENLDSEGTIANAERLLKQLEAKQA